MPNTTVNLSVSDMTDSPFQVQAAPLTGAKWEENPVNQVINVENTKTFTAIGEQPYSGSLMFLYNFESFTLNFAVSNDILTYQTVLPSDLTDLGSTVQGFTLNLTIRPA